MVDVYASSPQQTSGYAMVMEYHHTRPTQGIWMRVGWYVCAAAYRRTSATLVRIG